MFPSPVPLRDPAIKLFGRNIPVTQSNIPAPSLQRVSPFPAMPKVKDECQEAPKSDADNSLLNESFRLDLPSDFEQRKECTSENHNRENGIVMNQNSGEDQCAESNNSSKEKPFKRPDKVLPCPRCNSLETKFCYFNNYNVNQPRHFCKNCHRYWTAGGTIRNVPIGSGRRQNKRSYPHFQQAAGHLDASAINQQDNANSTGAQSSPCSSQTVNDMGGALKVGLDTPLCESMESLLSIKDHKKAEIRSSATGDYSEERSSSSSSLTATTSCENESLGKENNNSDPTNNLQHGTVQPSAYLWNVGWNTMMAKQDISDSSSSHMASLPMVTVPVGHCASSITFPFVPASCWGYMPTWDGRQWNALSLESTGSLTSSCSISQNGSGNRLPTLGKHSRDGNLQVEENSKQCLWVPKTLRIDDPNEAAKSSIWSTLGIKPQKDQPLKGDGIFKAFKQKIDLNSHEVDGDQVLQSNPAALSRSHSFQENT